MVSISVRLKLAQIYFGFKAAYMLLDSNTSWTQEAEVSTKVILKGRRSATAEGVALTANRGDKAAANKRKRRGAGEEAGQKRRVDYTNSAAVFAQLQDTQEAKPAKRTRAVADSGSRAFKL